MGKDGKILTKSLYGNVALMKVFCYRCRKKAFVIDGILQCCDAKVTRDFTIQRVKREVDTEHKRSFISPTMKKEILTEQEHRCIYCNHNLIGVVWNETKCKYIKNKIHFDHFIPWVYSGNANKYNLVASCHICNLLKHNKYFHDILSAKEFILEERKKKGYL